MCRHYVTPKRLPVIFTVTAITARFGITFVRYTETQERRRMVTLSNRKRLAWIGIPRFTGL
jgi:hypothetical protein